MTVQERDGRRGPVRFRGLQIYSFFPRPCVSIQFDTKIVTSQSFCFIVQQLRCNSETTEPITGTLQAGRFTAFTLTLGTTVFVLHLFLGKGTVALAINKVKAVQEMIVRSLVRRRDCGGCVKEMKEITTEPNSPLSEEQKTAEKKYTTWNYRASEHHSVFQQLSQLTSAQHKAPPNKFTKRKLLIASPQSWLACWSWLGFVGCRMGGRQESLGCFQFSNLLLH